MRHFFISLTLVLTVATMAAAEGISVSQSLDRSQIAFEDSVTFTVTLTWPGPQYAYRFDRPLEPSMQGLKVAAFSSSISSSGEGAAETTTKEYNFKLAPTESGEDRIEAIEIAYVAYPDSIPGSLMTEPVTVQVAKPLPAPEPGSFSRIWWIVGVSAVIFVAVLLWMYLKIVRRKDVGEVVLSPKDIVLEQLETMHRESAGDFKKFQSGLYKILIGYLSARCGIEADTLDDDALAEAIAITSLPETAKEKITDWLVTARKDKFRPVDAAPGEAIRLESEVRELFEKL